MLEFWGVPLLSETAVLGKKMIFSAKLPAQEGFLLC